MDKCPSCGAKVYPSDKRCSKCGQELKKSSNGSVIAILLFVMLCGIGIKADLKNPKVHWVIEISNVLCQLLVAIATLILFK